MLLAISDENDRLTIIIPKKLKEEIRSLARESNRSMGNYIVTIIKEHVEKMKNK